MSGAPDRASVVALPKAELHLHLEAAMRPGTARELAGRLGAPAPRHGPYAGQREFVGDYESARDLITSLDDLYRVAGEIVEDAAAQGIVWTELHCVPFNYGGRLGPAEGIVEAVLDGLRSGHGRTGSAAALILAHNRAAGPAQAWQVLDLARRYQCQGVVALGLAGDEAGYPPAPYAEVFAAARAAGLLAVPHAGEGAGPASVRAAWQELGAHRISHGMSAAADPGLLAELAAAQVCLDVCPTSNVMLRACPSIGEHPLPRLLEAGVAVSLGSDGPLFFGASLVDEYLTAARVFGLGAGELRAIAANSLRFSAAPRELVEPR